MEFTVNQYKLVIRWCHLYLPTERKYKGNNTRLEKHPKSTVCNVVLYKDEEYLNRFSSVSYCHYKDNFSRKIGRRISLMKALIESPLSEYEILNVIKQHETR